MPPGHVPAAVAGTELVMFSPQDELAPLPAGKYGRGEQPEDSYQAGFCLSDEDDAKHNKPDACSVKQDCSY
jgi:hypothetical protein